MTTIAAEHCAARQIVKDKTNNVNRFSALKGCPSTASTRSEGTRRPARRQLYRAQPGRRRQPNSSCRGCNVGWTSPPGTGNACTGYITGRRVASTGRPTWTCPSGSPCSTRVGLSGELRTFGMMVVIDQVWNRVIRNKANGRRTWLYVDEFHFFSTSTPPPSSRTSTSVPRIRARRHRHHAERRGDPRPPGRARDAVQQRFPHAPEPEQHRRGRWLLT